MARVHYEEDLTPLEPCYEGRCTSNTCIASKSTDPVPTEKIAKFGQGHPRTVTVPTAADHCLISHFVRIVHGKGSSSVCANTASITGWSVTLPASSASVRCAMAVGSPVIDVRTTPATGSVLEPPTARPTSNAAAVRSSAHEATSGTAWASKATVTLSRG